MNRRKTEKRRGERKSLFWMERERLREEEVKKHIQGERLQLQ